MNYDKQQDVVYGYKDGMGLIMDVFTPSAKRNGAAVIWLLSGGFRSNLGFDNSSRGYLPPSFISRFKRSTHSLLDAGYVVFAVAHSSAPKYRIDEIIPEISRAVRFIRHHAERFGISPHRIGIRSGSAGGMLSLMAATAAPAPDPEAEDPVDRTSSQVQAVVAYFPPADLLNFRDPHTTFPPDDFHYWDEETQLFERVVNPEERKAILRRCSPITHASADSPPILLLHGDEDEVVPIQQSELFAARLKEVGVEHRLIVARGKGHGWEPSEGELNEIIGWFDQYLLVDEQV